ncbi:MAG: hypothetical protein HQL70_01525 [Magnetococcales bacterium]|nr:hypothetical protein [Magnetococcales bacterium]
MPALLFIGDEISAAGWSLAGVNVITPQPGGEERAVEKAMQEAELLIITSEVAELITPGLLEKILTSTSVLTHVVGDIQNRHPLPDYAGLLRAKLGLGQ